MITIPKGKGPTTRAGFKYDNKGRLLDADGNRVPLHADISGVKLVIEQMKQDRHSNGFQPIDFGVGDKLGNTYKWEAYFGDNWRKY